MKRDKSSAGPGEAMVNSSDGESGSQSIPELGRLRGRRLRRSDSRRASSAEPPIVQCKLPLDRITDILSKITKTKTPREKIPPVIDYSAKSDQESSSLCEPSSAQPLSVGTVEENNSAQKKTNALRLMCLFCDRTFGNGALLQKHTERSHHICNDRRSSTRNADKPSPTRFHPGCNICSKTSGVQTATNLSALFDHLVDEHPAKYTACKMCKLRFSTRSLLISHNKDIHNVQLDNICVNSEALDVITDTSLRSEDETRGTPKIDKVSKSLLITGDNDKRKPQMNTYSQSSGEISQRATSLVSKKMNSLLSNKDCLKPNISVKKNRKGKSLERKNLKNKSHISEDLSLLEIKQALVKECKKKAYISKTDGLAKHADKDDSDIDFEESIMTNLIISYGKAIEANRLEKNINFDQNAVIVLDDINAQDKKILHLKDSITSSITRVQIEPDANDNQILSRLGVTQNRSPRARSLRKLRKAPITDNRSSSDSTKKDKTKIKNDNNDFVINKNKNDPNSKFDPDFYLNVSMNVRENLVRHLDGKLGNQNNISDFHETVDPKIYPTHAVIQAPPIQLAEIHGSDVSLNAITIFPTLLTSDQYGSDKVPHYSYGAKVQTFKKIVTKNSWKWKWDPIKKYKYCNEDGKVIRKIRQLQHVSPRDLSKLDIWTQLSMREKYDRNIVFRESKKDTTREENLKTERQKQVNELNTILDSRVFPELEKECLVESIEPSVASTSSIASFEDATAVSSSSGEVVACVKSGETDNELLSSLGLVARHKQSASSSPPVLSGEWARPRCYVCCVCGRRAACLRLLEAHQATRHPQVHATHYELVGQELLQTELYKHLYLPAVKKDHHQAIGKNKVRKQTIARQMKKLPGRLLDISRSTRILRTTTRNIKSMERECTKCKKMLLPAELYKHILECAGDYGWIMAKKKCKYKPFGARKRRLKGLYKRERPEEDGEIRDSRLKDKTIRPKIPPRPRTKPSDVETIQRMLANLPAKRASRQILTLPSPKNRGHLNPDNKQSHILHRILPSKCNPQRKKVISTTVVTTVKSVSGKRLRRITRSVSNKASSLSHVQFVGKSKRDAPNKDSPVAKKKIPSISANNMQDNETLPKASGSKLPKEELNNFEPEKNKGRPFRISKNGVSSAAHEDLSVELRQKKKYTLRRRAVVSSKIIRTFKSTDPKLLIKSRNLNQKHNIKDGKEEMAVEEMESTSETNNDSHSENAESNKSLNEPLNSTLITDSCNRKTKKRNKKMNKFQSEKNMNTSVSNSESKANVNNCNNNISDISNSAEKEDVTVNEIIEPPTITSSIAESSATYSSLAEQSATESSLAEQSATESSAPECSVTEPSVINTECYPKEVLHENVNEIVTSLPISLDTQPTPNTNVVTVGSFLHEPNTNLSGFNCSQGAEGSNQRNTKTPPNSHFKKSKTSELKNESPVGSYINWNLPFVATSESIQTLRSDSLTIEPVRRLNNAYYPVTDNIDKPPLSDIHKQSYLSIRDPTTTICGADTTIDGSPESKITRIHLDMNTSTECESISKESPKNKLSKSRRGLNDCIAMLKDKLTERTPSNEILNLSLPASTKTMFMQDYEDLQQPLDLSGRIPQAEDLSIKSVKLIEPAIKETPKKTVAPKNISKPIRKPVYDPTLRIPQYSVNTLNKRHGQPAQSRIVSDSTKKTHSDASTPSLTIPSRKTIPNVAYKPAMEVQVSTSQGIKNMDLPRLRQELALLPQTLADTIEKLSPLLQREEIVKALPQVFAQAVENFQLLRTDTLVKLPAKHSNSNLNLKKNNIEDTSSVKKANIMEQTSSSTSHLSSMIDKSSINTPLPHTSEISTQTIAHNREKVLQVCPPEFHNVNTDLFLIDPVTGMIIERNNDAVLHTSPIMNVNAELSNDKMQEDFTRVCTPIIDLTRDSSISNNDILSDEGISSHDPLKDNLKIQSEIKINEESLCSNFLNNTSFDLSKTVESGTASLRAVRIKSVNGKPQKKTNEYSQIEDNHLTELGLIETQVPSDDSEKHVDNSTQNKNEDIAESFNPVLLIENTISSSKDMFQELTVQDHLDTNLSTSSINSKESAIQQDEVSSTQHSDCTVTESIITKQMDNLNKEKSPITEDIIGNSQITKILDDGVQNKVSMVSKHNNQVLCKNKDDSILESQVSKPKRSLRNTQKISEDIENKEDKQYVQETKQQDPEVIDEGPKDVLKSKRVKTPSKTNANNTTTTEYKTKSIIKKSSKGEGGAKTTDGKRVTKKSLSMDDDDTETSETSNINDADKSVIVKKINAKILINDEIKLRRKNKHISIIKDNIDLPDDVPLKSGKDTDSLLKVLPKNFLMNEAKILSETALTPSNVIEFQSEVKQSDNNDKVEEIEYSKISLENKQTAIVRRSLRKNKKSPGSNNKNSVDPIENCNDIYLNPDVSGAAIIPGESCKANLGKTAEKSSSETDDGLGNQSLLEVTAPVGIILNDDSEDDMCLADMAKKKSHLQLDINDTITRQKDKKGKNKKRHEILKVKEIEDPEENNEEKLKSNIEITPNVAMKKKKIQKKTLKGKKVKVTVVTRAKNLKNDNIDNVSYDIDIQKISDDKNTDSTKANFINEIHKKETKECNNIFPLKKRKIITTDFGISNVETVPVVNIHQLQEGNILQMNDKTRKSGRLSTHKEGHSLISQNKLATINSVQLSENGHLIFKMNKESDTNKSISTPDKISSETEVSSPQDEIITEQSKFTATKYKSKKSSENTNREKHMSSDSHGIKTSPESDSQLNLVSKSIVSMNVNKKKINVKKDDISHLNLQCTTGQRKDEESSSSDESIIKKDSDQNKISEKSNDVSQKDKKNKKGLVDPVTSYNSKYTSQKPIHGNNTLIITKETRLSRKTLSLEQVTDEVNDPSEPKNPTNNKEFSKKTRANRKTKTIVNDMESDQSDIHQENKNKITHSDNLKSSDAEIKKIHVSSTKSTEESATTDMSNLPIKCNLIPAVDKDNLTTWRISNHLGDETIDSVKNTESHSDIELKDSPKNNNSAKKKHIKKKFCKNVPVATLSNDDKVFQKELCKMNLPKCILESTPLVEIHKAPTVEPDCKDDCVDNVDNCDISLQSGNQSSDSGDFLNVHQLKSKKGHKKTNRTVINVVKAKVNSKINKTTVDQADILEPINIVESKEIEHPLTFCSGDRKTRKQRNNVTKIQDSTHDKISAPELSNINNECSNLNNVSSDLHGSDMITKRLRKNSNRIEVNSEIKTKNDVDIILDSSTQSIEDSVSNESMLCLNPDSLAKNILDIGDNHNKNLSDKLNEKTQDFEDKNKYIHSTESVLIKQISKERKGKNELSIKHNLGFHNKTIKKTKDMKCKRKNKIKGIFNDFPKAITTCKVVKLSMSKLMSREKSKQSELMSDYKDCSTNDLEIINATDVNTSQPIVNKEELERNSVKNKVKRNKLKNKAEKKIETTNPNESDMKSNNPLDEKQLTSSTIEVESEIDCSTKSMTDSNNTNMDDESKSIQYFMDKAKTVINKGKKYNTTMIHDLNLQNTNELLEEINNEPKSKVRKKSRKTLQNNDKRSPKTPENVVDICVKRPVVNLHKVRYSSDLPSEDVTSKCSSIIVDNQSKSNVLDTYPVESEKVEKTDKDVSKDDNQSKLVNHPNYPSINESVGKKSIISSTSNGLNTGFIKQKTLKIHEDTVTASVRPQRISYRRQTLARCEHVEKDIENHTSDEESLKQDKYLADFGMFTEKRPRKSTILAIKKISQTFKPDFSDRDEDGQRKKDPGLRRSSRPHKKRHRKASLNQDSKTQEQESTVNESSSVSPLDQECVQTCADRVDWGSVHSDDGLSTDEPISTLKTNKSHENKSDTYCPICKKKFRRSENLLKHKMTLMHISKLSEIEAKIVKCKSIEGKDISIEQLDNINAEQSSENPVTIDIVSKCDTLRTHKNLAERKSFENALNNIESDDETTLDKLKNENSALLEKKINVEELPSISVDTSRKQLSRDEALFFECCSLLKESDSTRKQINDIESQGAAKYSQSESADTTITYKVSTKNNSPHSQIISHTINESVEIQITGNISKIEDCNIEENNEKREPVCHDTELESSSSKVSIPTKPFNELKKQKLKNSTFNSLTLSSGNELENEEGNNDIELKEKRLNEPSCSSFDLPKTTMDSVEHDPYAAETLMARTNSGEFSDNGDSIMSTLDSTHSATQTFASNPIPAVSKCTEDINVNLNEIEFEDKFDKIKRKAREKAQAAHEAIVASKSSKTHSSKSQKISHSKSKNSSKHSDYLSKFSHPTGKHHKKKFFLSNPKVFCKKVLTKGALKGFDGVKASIPTEEINLECAKSVLDEFPIYEKKKSDPQSKAPHKQVTVQSSPEAEEDDYAGSKKDELHYVHKMSFIEENKTTDMQSSTTQIHEDKQNLDIYEFFDDEDNVSDNFTFRTPVIFNSKDKNISNPSKKTSDTCTSDKNTLDSHNEDSQISSLSFSDRDDFTYMSDDYIGQQSEEETNLSSNSVEVNTLKSNKKHKKLNKVQRNIKKSAIMGKIFKNNAIRNDQKNQKEIISENSSKDFSVSAQTDMDQLFDSLFEKSEVPKEINTSDNEETSSRHDPQEDDLTCTQSNDTREYPEELQDEPIPCPRPTHRKIVPRLKARSSDDEDDNSAHASPTTSSHELLYKNSDKAGLEIFKANIGVASRKSQRKCTTGKQNVLVESWSSESDYEDFRQFEEYSSIPRSQRHHRRPRRSGRHRPTDDAKTPSENNDSQSTPPVRKKHRSSHVDSKRDQHKGSSHDSSRSKSRMGRRVSFNMQTHNSKGCSSKRRRRQSQKPFDFDDEFKPARIAEPLATQRRNKRAASEMLYYWSSSSDDDAPASAADGLCRDPEPIEQHGWIVGDSHKKLVTMLAHAKGRKLDDNASVKEKKSRPST